MRCLGRGEIRSRASRRRTQPSEVLAEYIPVRGLQGGALAGVEGAGFLEFAGQVSSSEVTPPLADTRLEIGATRALGGRVMWVVTPPCRG